MLRYLLVCVIVLRTGSWPLGSRGAPCSPAVTDTVWVDEPENSSVTVEWGRQEAFCDSLHTCIGNNGNPDAEMPIQLHPVVVQRGVTLRLNPGVMQEKLSYHVLKTDKAGFKDCAGNNSVDVKTDATSGPFIVPVAFLELGPNYFIINSSDNSSVSCQNGYRLNVTVRGHDCSLGDSNRKCSGRGHCVVASHDQKRFTCSCCHGYHGHVCQYCHGDSCGSNNSCAADTCKHGGTCLVHANSATEVGNATSADYEDIIVLGKIQNFSSEIEATGQSYDCLCTAGYTGRNCEISLNDCSSNPCINGICVPGPIIYQCYCIPGYHGERCEKEYNECLSSPCNNGGVCVDLLDQYECSCTHGYQGMHCQTKVNLCKPNPCHNGSCSDEGDSFSCTCPPGRTGSRCEQNQNECASSPCQNDGTCRDLDGGFQCICPVTFAGVHCEYMMDVFAPPLEGATITGENHVHNLYIVAGTLSGAILIVIVVLTGCYCKMHETYKQLSWRRMRYRKRSLSCSNLDTHHDVTSVNKARLSVDAIWEATSLCYDNATFDTPRQPLNTRRV